MTEASLLDTETLIARHEVVELPNYSALTEFGSSFTFGYLVEMDLLEYPRSGACFIITVTRTGTDVTNVWALDNPEAIERRHYEVPLDEGVGIYESLIRDLISKARFSLL